MKEPRIIKGAPIKGKVLKLEIGFGFHKLLNLFNSRSQISNSKFTIYTDSRFEIPKLYTVRSPRTCSYAHLEQCIHCIIYNFFLAFCRSPDERIRWT